MRVLDLFSGIGGFALGLERAGMTTAAFCEIDPFCRAVLRKHWPGVPIYEDVRALSASILRRDGITVDVICGGFPCQDLSLAGKRSGLEGARSGLWGEYRRIIGEIRPKFVIVENVPGLLSLGMGTVLGDFSALRYDAVWDCIPASAIGAPHRRDRVWIIAYASGEQHESDSAQVKRPPAEKLPDTNTDSYNRRPDAAGYGLPDRQAVVQQPDREACADNDFSICANVSDASRSECEWVRPIQGGQQGGFANSGRRQPECGLGQLADGFPDWLDGGQWVEEPEGVPRVIKGQENRASRLKALGNAVVPQVVELIGRAIMRVQHD